MFAPFPFSSHTEIFFSPFIVNINVPPLTVFAPTNDAFENLPAGTVETLLKPESKASLTKVLTYHVLSGSYNFEELKNQIDNSIAKGFMTENPLGKFVPGNFTAENYDTFDLHKPYADNIVLEKNGKKLFREPDLIDVWFGYFCL